MKTLHPKMNNLSNSAQHFFEWKIGNIVHSDSNGFSRAQNRDLRENVNDDSDKSSFQPQNQIMRDSETKMEALEIDETKSSGNG